MAKTMTNCGKITLWEKLVKDKCYLVRLNINSLCAVSGVIRVSSCLWWVTSVLPGRKERGPPFTKQYTFTKQGEGTEIFLFAFSIVKILNMPKWNIWK